MTYPRALPPADSGPGRGIEPPQRRAERDESGAPARYSRGVR